MVSKAERQGAAPLRSCRKATASRRLKLDGSTPSTAAAPSTNAVTQSGRRQPNKIVTTTEEETSSSSEEEDPKTRRGCRDPLSKRGRRDDSPDEDNDTDRTTRRGKRVETSKTTGPAARKKAPSSVSTSNGRKAVSGASGGLSRRGKTVFEDDESGTNTPLSSSGSETVLQKIAFCHKSNQSCASVFWTVKNGKNFPYNLTKMGTVCAPSEESDHPPQLQAEAAIVAVSGGGGSSDEAPPRLHHGAPPTIGSTPIGDAPPLHEDYNTDDDDAPPQLSPANIEPVVVPPVPEMTEEEVNPLVNNHFFTGSRGLVQKQKLAMDRPPKAPAMLDKVNDDEQEFQQQQQQQMAAMHSMSFSTNPYASMTTAAHPQPYSAYPAAYPTHFDPTAAGFAGANPYWQTGYPHYAAAKGPAMGSMMPTTLPRFPIHIPTVWHQ
ncbi:hypothetical protein TELCIR_08409 [Teladorsagia circumcincta]|uniref:Uncharacterized protein n=1 Tax=Teladorsagia circumcincta TaxID=45464 RepID=A0A2G9UHN1_TELCI|nr:hypothetical protein TELCIR_08409 [Teladorsagia circumcincta]